MVWTRQPGVIAIQCTDRNGQLASAVQIVDADDPMLIGDQGTLVRTRADEVSVVGRNTQGVRLIRLADDESWLALNGLKNLLDKTDSEAVGEKVMTPTPS